MRERTSSIALAAVSLLCFVFLAACNCSPSLRYIGVTPSSATINTGETQLFTATAYYSDGTALVGQTGATWSSSNTSVATISSSGLAQGLTPGTVTITASQAGASNTAILTVNQGYTAIVVNCIPGSVPIGLTSTCTATGTPPASGVNITSLVTWSSSADASITVAGVATGVTAGTANISAKLGNVTSNTFVLTITPSVVTGITIAPAANPIAIGNATLYTAMETLSGGGSQTPAGTVNWTATNCSPAAAPPTPAAASIVGGTAANGIGNGFAIANGALAGSCTITATDGALPAVASTLNVVTGKTHNAYVSDNGSLPNGILQYAVDATSATPIMPLTPAAAATTQLSYQTLVHPNGKWVYSIDSNSLVHTYDVASGALTVRSGDPTVIVGGGSGDSNRGVIDPTGRFMYVVDFGPPASVTALTINQTTGLLTVVQTITNPTAPTLSYPIDVLVDRQGKTVYVVDDVLNQIDGYSIDPNTGILTALSATAVGTTGAGPFYSTIDPTNTYLFVPNNTDNTVSTFQILSTGLLSPVAGSPTTVGPPAPFGIVNVVVNPASTILYVLDSTNSTTGAIYAFPIGGGGILGAPVSVYNYTDSPGGTAADGIVIDPTGKLVAVDNNFGPNITPFSVGAGGVLTPEANVPAGSSPFFVTFLNAP